MKKIQALAVAVMMAGVAGGANATIAAPPPPPAPAPGDIFLGDAPGTYDVEGQNKNGNDSSFYVTLGPGTYTFSSSGLSDPTSAFNKVWLSYSDDKRAHNGNDIVDFSKTDKHDVFLSQTGTYTFKDTTTVYLNVDTTKDKRPFSGFFTVSSVSAVPEPATGALLLAGLGMLGFMGRRRRG
jgi:hypothetical protein